MIWKKHPSLDWKRRERSLLEQLIRTRFSALMTLLLVTSIGLLGTGIVLQLPIPGPPAPPSFFTPVAYSTLLEQVQSGQVKAANIQGHALDALLRPTQRELPTADAAFGACWPQDPSGCFDEEGQPLFPRARVIFTFMPEQALLSVLTLLLKKHVVVVIARVYTTPLWVPLLWKVAPWWIAFLLILEMGVPKQRKW